MIQFNIPEHEFGKIPMREIDAAIKDQDKWEISYYKANSSMMVHDAKEFATLFFDILSSMVVNDLIRDGVLTPVIMVEVSERINSHLLEGTKWFLKLAQKYVYYVVDDITYQSAN